MSAFATTFGSGTKSSARVGLVAGQSHLRRGLEEAIGLRRFAGDRTAFFSLDSVERVGTLVEYDTTEKIFSNPVDTHTRDYVTGRFG